MRVFPSLLLALLLPGTLAAQQDWRPTQDIFSVQERPAFLEAFGLIAAGREDEAVAGLTAVLEAHPDDPDRYIVAYNLACAHARRGRTGAALEWLEQAVDLGYGLQVGQTENLHLDPDLQGLVAEPRFTALVERADRNLEQLAADWNDLMRPAVYRPERPAAAAGEPWPVLLLLHGYAGSKEDILARFRPFADRHGFLLVAPSSTHLISPGRWAWYVDPTEFLDEYRRDTRIVWTALQTAKQQGPIDPARVFVTGHGQGASLGFALVERNPQWLRGAVLFGGGYAPSVLAGWLKAAAWWRRPVRLVHGAEDPVFPPGDLPAFRDLCREHGLPVTLDLVPGGHDLPDDLEARLAAALAGVEEEPFDRGPVPRDLMQSTEITLPPVPDKADGAGDR